MSKRYTVLGLSVVLALALAVPALGGPSNPIASVSASVKQTATKALKKAKAAQKTANSALSAANTAQNDANSAQNTANTANTAAKKAQDTASAAQTSANGAKTAADSAKTAADNAQATANSAASAAAAAEANANTRVQGVYREFGPGSVSDNDTNKSDSAFCEGSDEATGGGYTISGTSSSVTVTSSTPTFYGDGWFVTGQAISGTPTWSIQAQAVCAEK